MLNSELSGKYLMRSLVALKKSLARSRVAFQGGVWARLIEKVEAFIMGSGRTVNAAKVEGRMDEGE